MWRYGLRKVNLNNSNKQQKGRPLRSNAFVMMLLLWYHTPLCVSLFLSLTGVTEPLETRRVIGSPNTFQKTAGAVLSLNST